ncbi:MAG: hypothetical protein IPG50_18700 [Myxococcales bacterium]|nr:hypothetical protein [Myxococcales bacterium]
MRERLAVTALTLHESASPSGELYKVSLDVREGTLIIVCGAEAFAVPDGALAATMARYGGPFDPTERVADAGVLALGATERLRHVRHLARFDVVARDFVVHESPNQEALCALATTVAGALEFVARASAGARSAPPRG